MRVGSAEMGGLIEIVECSEPSATWPGRRSPGSTSAGAGACGEIGGGRTRVEFRFAYGVAGGGITGYVSERVAAPSIRGHLRRSLQQLKRQVEHEKRRHDAAERRAERQTATA